MWIARRNIGRAIDGPRFRSIRHGRRSEDANHTAFDFKADERGIHHARELDDSASAPRNEPRNLNDQGGGEVLEVELEHQRLIRFRQRDQEDV